MKNLANFRSLQKIGPVLDYLEVPAKFDGIAPDAAARGMENTDTLLIESAVHQDSWREYGRSEMPEDPDFGLLFQDPAGMQAKVDGLGAYSRKILPDSMGQGILSGVRRITRR